MIKQCPICTTEIHKKSKQWVNQTYCSTKCRKIANLKKKSKIARIEKKRANLVQNDEILYLVKQCRRAGTVQILTGHDFQSFLETMSLVRNRPKGDVKLCHIAPVKGKNSTGLFHCQNLFYGGTHQNRRFGKKYLSGGLSINHNKLKKKWIVVDSMSNNDVLKKIEIFLGDVIQKYLEVSPVRKSKRVQLVQKIIEVEKSKSFEKMMELSHKQLADKWRELSNTITFQIDFSKESKYLAYMDSLTRFISYGGERASLLKKLRKVMVIGYMALERVKRSNTHNEYFYVYYEPLINIKYGQAMMKTSDDWSTFKDFIYDTAFKVLQGGNIDIKAFRRKLMSYLKFPEKASVDDRV